MAWIIKLTKWPLDYIVWGISMKALLLLIDNYPFPETKDGQKIDDEGDVMNLLGGDMDYI